MIRHVICWNCECENLEILDVTIDSKKKQVREKVLCPKCRNEEIVAFDFKKKIIFTIY